MTIFVREVIKKFAIILLAVPMIIAGCLEEETTLNNDMEMVEIEEGRTDSNGTLFIMKDDTVTLNIDALLTLNTFVIYTIDGQEVGRVEVFPEQPEKGTDASFLWTVNVEKGAHTLGASFSEDDVDNEDNSDMVQFEVR